MAILLPGPTIPQNLRTECKTSDQKVHENHSTTISLGHAPSQDSWLKNHIKPRFPCHHHHHRCTSSRTCSACMKQCSPHWHRTDPPKVCTRCISGNRTLRQSTRALLVAFQMERLLGRASWNYTLVSRKRLRCPELSSPLHRTSNQSLDPHSGEYEAAVGATHHRCTHKQTRSTCTSHYTRMAGQPCHTRGSSNLSLHHGRTLALRRFLLECLLDMLGWTS